MRNPRFQQEGGLVLQPLWARLLVGNESKNLWNLKIQENNKKTTDVNILIFSHQTPLKNKENHIPKEENKQEKKRRTWKWKHIKTVCVKLTNKHTNKHGQLFISSESHCCHLKVSSSVTSSLLVFKQEVTPVSRCPVVTWSRCPVVTWTRWVTAVPQAVWRRRWQPAPYRTPPGRWLLSAGSGAPVWGQAQVSSGKQSRLWSPTPCD